MDIKWYMVKFVTDRRVIEAPYSEDEMEWVVNEPYYVSHSEILPD